MLQGCDSLLFINKFTLEIALSWEVALILVLVD